MNITDTEKIVRHIVDAYHSTAKAVHHAENHGNAEFASWMSGDTFDADAAAIMTAYNDGKFENVTEPAVEGLMKRYGASDIYHLTASYFNATGKILKVE